MSANSIKNQDYTSVDFLEQLMSSPNKISSQSYSNKVISQGELSHDRSVSEKNHYYHNPHTHLKIIRTHSLLETQPKQMKHFKMLYDILIKGMYDREECENLWRKFSLSCDSSTYEVEQFLKTFTKRRQQQLFELKNKEQQIKQLKKVLELQKHHHSHLTHKNHHAHKHRHKKVCRSKTCVASQKVERRQRSAGKKQFNEQGVRRKIKKEAGYIRKVLQHGQKFIHS